MIDVYKILVSSLSSYVVHGPGPRLQFQVESLAEDSQDSQELPMEDSQDTLDTQNSSNGREELHSVWSTPYFCLFAASSVSHASVVKATGTMTTTMRKRRKRGASSARFPYA